MRLILTLVLCMSGLALLAMNANAQTDTLIYGEDTAFVSGNYKQTYTQVFDSIAANLTRIIPVNCPVSSKTKKAAHGCFLNRFMLN